MAHEMGTGALLKVKHSQGRESTFYGGSVHLTKASQKNLILARKGNLDNQTDKGNIFKHLASFYLVLLKEKILQTLGNTIEPLLY